MKKIQLILLILLVLGVQHPGAAQCFFKVHFMEGFNEQQVSFYVNDKLIFKDEAIIALKSFLHENNQMDLLFTRISDSTIYVSNLYSQTNYEIKPYLLLKPGWHKEDIILKIIRNKETFIRKVNLSNGPYVDIYYDAEKKDISFYVNKKP